MSDVDLQNKAGYTAVMLASLTAPDGPGGVEVVRRLMELGDVNISSSQVPGRKTERKLKGNRTPKKLTLKDEWCRGLDSFRPK